MIRTGDIVASKANWHLSGFVVRTEIERDGSLDVLVDWGHREPSWIGADQLTVIGVAS